MAQEEQLPSQAKLSMAEIQPLAYAEAAQFMLPTDWQNGRQQVYGFAIDEAYSPDIDDAISVRPDGDGYVLTTSIADVATFVPPESYSNRLARKLMATHYRNNMVERPMLPPDLSEDKLSLLHNQPRPVMAVDVPISPMGEVGPVQIRPALIQAQRLSYQTADEYLAKPEAEDELGQQLKQLGHVARLLHNARYGKHNDNFILDYDPSNAKGDAFALSGSFIIAQTMIATNAGLASYARQHDIPVLFRNYSLHTDIARLTGVDLRRAVRTQGIRASYSREVGGHDALKVSEYLHGTSPLRRLPDLMNQGNLLAHLANQEVPYDQDRLDKVAMVMNGRAATAKKRSSPNKQAAKEVVDAQLLARLRGTNFAENDIADGLFNGATDPQMAHDLRAAAAHAIAQRVTMARQVLNIGVARGLLLVRRSEPADRVTTRHTLQDVLTGVAYPYAKNRKTTKYQTITAEERRRYLLSDAQTIAAIAGVQIEATTPEDDERTVLAKNAYLRLNMVQDFHRIGFQVNGAQNADGTYTMTAYVKDNGQLIEKTATADTLSKARGLACAEILLEIDWMHEAGDKIAKDELFLKQTLARIAEDPKYSPVAKLNAYAKNTRNSTSVQYSQSPVSGSPLQRCTIALTDRNGTEHSVEAIARNGKHAQILAAQKARQLLREIKAQPLAAPAEVEAIVIAEQQASLEPPKKHYARWRKLGNGILAVVFGRRPRSHDMIETQGDQSGQSD